MNPPSIKLILLNRSTQYNKKASKAFGAMFDEIKKRAKKLLNDEPAARGGQMAEYFLDVPVFDKSPQVNSEPLNPDHS